MTLEIISLVISILVLIALVVGGVYLFLHSKKEGGETKNDVGVSSEIGQIKEKLDNLQKDIPTQIKTQIDSATGKMKMELTEKASQNAKEQSESQFKFLDNFSNNFNNRVEDLDRKVNETIEKLDTNLKTNVDNLNGTVNKTIKESFKTTNDQVTKVSESLARIQTAQDNLKDLNQNMNDLKATLSFSGPLGKFGEKTLGVILRSVFGETRDIYKEQEAIVNEEGQKFIADAIIHLPSPLKKLCIDSKFSYAKYSALFNSELKGEEEKKKKAEFKAVLKQEIDKIANSYIIRDETCDFALMFIPNDGIYVYIQSDEMLYHDVVEYAFAKHVIITSPSTIQPILFNLNLFSLDIKRTENTAILIKEMGKINKSLKNFQDSWSKFSSEVDKVLGKKRDFEAKTNTLISDIEKVADINIDETEEKAE